MGKAIKMSESFEDLKRRAKEEWQSLQRSETPRILVGTATCGRSAGAMDAIEVFRSELDRRGLEGDIMEVGCIGLCYAEPIVMIVKPGRPGICYSEVTAERAVELVEAYLVGDDPLPDYALGTVGDGSVDGILPLFETPVFKPQVRRTLRNCGFIDPTNLNHYIAGGGYEGIEKALAMGPKEVIEEVKRSGLRGRQPLISRPGRTCTAWRAAGSPMAAPSASQPAQAGSCARARGAPGPRGAG